MTQLDICLSLFCKISELKCLWGKGNNIELYLRIILISFSTFDLNFTQNYISLYYVAKYIYAMVMYSLLYLTGIGLLGLIDTKRRPMFFVIEEITTHL